MDCPHIPHLGYGDFSQRLHEKVGSQRIPISGSLELNFRCNFRCQHCYVAHGHTGIPGKQELSTVEYQRILDELADAGTFWLLLTGGEPLLRRDFAEIYTYAKRKGFLLTLFTNGSLITPRIADLLAEWRPFSVEITTYGYTPETYELVTGIPGSHARVQRGIELLIERKIPLKLKTMVMTLNQHELDDMRAYADRLGLSFRYDAMLNAGFEENKRPVELRISPEQVVALDLADERRLESWREFMGRVSASKRDPERLYQCGAGLYTFHIDPYGELSLCLMARDPSYDLRQGSFQEGWEGFLPRVCSQPSQGEYICGECVLRVICDHCPGAGILERGDPQARIDFQCKVSHLRAENIFAGYFCENSTEKITL